MTIYDGRLLNSVNPCRGCGAKAAYYGHEQVLHDEITCMREHEIRFFLGVSVFRRVVFQLGDHAFPIVGKVERTTAVPWMKYLVRAGVPPLDDAFRVEPHQILDVLPQDMSDTEAVERWLASG